MYCFNSKLIESTEKNGFIAKAGMAKCVRMKCKLITSQ